MEERLDPKEAIALKHLSIDLTGVVDERMLDTVRRLSFHSKQSLEILILSMEHYNQVLELDTLLPVLKKLHLFGMWDINSLPIMPMLSELVMGNCTLNNLQIEELKCLKILKILGCHFTIICIHHEKLDLFQFKLGRHRLNDGDLRVNIGSIERMILDESTPPYGQDLTLFKGLKMAKNRSLPT
ncbi:receptor-like protein 12-like protein [Corchorus olitorius]|uniref:Receptor-like protein 12-like protein n=1 Tax=Corchorus olitorius TaxID=93759 RepID=A0A1R3JEF5_9ROSI|nr:receptor-like protein 12-like protein [Corchorus olitorius]